MKHDLPGHKLADSILEIVGRVPTSGEHASLEPRDRAREIASRAAAKAALTAGGLALPVGPIGWLTILPELIAVWKIQAQMVADIARVYGRTANLSREQMIYCLFRHAASQGVRDLVVRVGERVLIQRATANALQAIARRIGVRITQREVAKGVAKWLPIVGALGVGAYAYYDTGQVARTATELFEREVIDVPIALDETGSLLPEPERAEQPDHKAGVSRRGQTPP